MDERTGTFDAIIVGLLIGAGLALGGYFVGRGFYSARAGDRYVTVKGLVERNVKADLGVWTISYTATAGQLADANAASQQDQAIVTAFAQAHGFLAGEIEIQPTTVTDTLANQFDNRPRDPAQRYIIKGGIKIRSTKVDRISEASQATGDLVKQGVVLGENYPQAPQYFYTKLNSIRPEMLADATRSARSVAEQFAEDSHSRLGPIRRASQGVFQITGRDASSDSAANMDDQASIDKKVRLVSTIDYYLISH
jgi:hypothetical protein